MAIAKVQKIQLIGISKHKDNVLDTLQDTGVLEIKDLSEDETKSHLHSEEKRQKVISELQKIELDYANVDFAIKLLSQHRKKKGLFAQPPTLTVEEVKEKAKEVNYKKITDQCTEIEEKMTKAQNEITALENELSLYEPWKKLKIDLENLSGTDNTSIILGMLKSDAQEEVYQGLNKISDLISIETVEQDNNSIYLVIVFAQELEKEIRQLLSQHKFSEAEFPNTSGLLKNYLKEQEEKIKENEKILKENESELKKLSKHVPGLEIVHDNLTWEKEKLEEAKKLGNTEYSFVISGWLPKEKLETVEEALGKVTNEYLVTEVEPEEDEIPPVILKNSKFMQPFEAVTGIYGTPKYTEIEPTPFLAAYFIIFFAMCLTDAGYGLIMFVMMALILKFFKLGESTKKLVKLLMYGGIVTFVIGGLFGGWFGLTVDQVPEFLTYTAESGEKLFIFQKINSVTDPLTVLILALALGFIQILMGTYMKFIHAFRHENKKDALLDTGTWAFMLTGIGFGILAAAGAIPSSLTVVGKWWVILGAILLILTQGREKKNIIGKFISGVLSLYALIGYLSDVLSYSRLLALGLATTIIGLAVNIIAALVGGVPYIGWLFMIIVFVGGHIFNLVINTLGSFIHSGRLQYVEFFGKFLEGGGTALKPFSKKSKYIFIHKSNQ